jgi:hypothetical protein
VARKKGEYLPTLLDPSFVKEGAANAASLQMLLLLVLLLPLVHLLSLLVTLPVPQYYMCVLLSFAICASVFAGSASLIVVILVYILMIFVSLEWGKIIIYAV